MGRVAIWIVVLAVASAGLFALREETMSRETMDADRGALLIVEFEVKAKSLPNHELSAVASSLFNACRLQAQAGLERPLTQVSADRFRAVLTPAPNETDRKQLGGCLSDLMLSHTRSGDVQMHVRQFDQA